MLPFLINCLRPTFQLPENEQTAPERATGLPPAFD
jgi:hypothetical protein